MYSTLNTLTAQLLAGQITCGAYADAVQAAQSGKVSSDSPVEYVNDDSEPGDDDDDSDACANCGDTDDTYCCNSCYRTTCYDCIVIYNDRAGCQSCRDDD